MRREARVKTEVLQMVERSPLPVRQTLQELKLSSATYYRWRRRYAEKGLEGLRGLLPKARRVWNRLPTLAGPPEERIFTPLPVPSRQITQNSVTLPVEQQPRKRHRNTESQAVSQEPPTGWKRFASAHFGSI